METGSRSCRNVSCHLSPFYVINCSKVNRRQEKSVMRSSEKVEITKGVPVQWHDEAFNDLLDIYLTCRNRRLLLSDLITQIHTVLVHNWVSFHSGKSERPSKGG